LSGGEDFVSERKTPVVCALLNFSQRNMGRLWDPDEECVREFLMWWTWRQFSWVL